MTDSPTSNVGLKIQGAMAWLRTIELACDARDDRQSVTYIGQVRAILYDLSRAADEPGALPQEVPAQHRAGTEPLSRLIGDLKFCLSQVNPKHQVHGVLSGVIDALRAAVPPSAWQPIETAPRNGSWVLVWWPAVTDVAFVAYMVNGEWRAATDGSRWPSLSPPTHWMPLPSAPETKSVTEGFPSETPEQERSMRRDRYPPRDPGEKSERPSDCCFSAGCKKPQMEGSVLCEEHYKALPAPMRAVESDGPRFPGTEGSGSKFHYEAKAPDEPSGSKL